MSKVPNTKYLRVTISQNLQWEEHVNTISARASKTLGFFRRNLRGCPKEFKQLAYFSLVRSKLEYAYASWDPHLIKDIQCLDKVQRRGASFVCNDYRRDSSVTGICWTASAGQHWPKDRKLSLKHDKQDYWWQGGTQQTRSPSRKQHPDKVQKQRKATATQCKDTCV